MNAFDFADSSPIAAFFICIAIALAIEAIAKGCNGYWNHKKSGDDE